MTSEAWQHFNQAHFISTSDSDVEIQLAVIDMFLTSRDEALDTLILGLTSGDEKRAAGAAHKFRGAAAIFGASGLVQLLKDIEDTMSPETLARTQQQVGTIMQMFDDLTHEVQTYRAKISV